MNVSINGPAPRIIAGIDVGGTNLRCALADADDPHRILVRRVVDTPTMDGPAPLLALVEQELAECLHALGLERDDLASVGCVTPGIVDGDARTIHTAVNLGGWNDVRLKALLERALGVPACLENDVNAAALAEHRYGAGAGCHSLVYLTVSTGVAAGVVIDGKVLRGFHHAAGEVGFFLLDPSHVGRHEGGNGCLERTAGGVGIARAWAALHGGPGTSVTAAQVFEAARDGHAGAVAIVDRAADRLAMAAVAMRRGPRGAVHLDVDLASRDERAPGAALSGAGGKRWPAVTCFGPRLRIPK